MAKIYRPPVNGFYLLNCGPSIFFVQDNIDQNNGGGYGPIKQAWCNLTLGIHIEKRPEGLYLATSDDVQGLSAQGRTTTEDLDIARDVARKLIEARAWRAGNINLTAISDASDCPFIANA